MNRQTDYVDDGAYDAVELILAFVAVHLVPVVLYGTHQPLGRLQETSWRPVGSVRG